MTETHDDMNGIDPEIEKKSPKKSSKFKAMCSWIFKLVPLILLCILVYDVHQITRALSSTAWGGQAIDVRVINTPDVRVTNTHGVRVTNTPDVRVTN